MEIIGKGEYELGAVWVAMKLPEGAVCAHANQARIQTFPLNDAENCLYAPDTISFARKIGLYTGEDSSFSFSDVYDPVSFGGARFCEARVWSFFGSLMGAQWAEQYLDYAMGRNLSNRMPLFIYPPSGVKITVAQTMEYMRSHYESTALDMSGTSFVDVGAEDDLTPYRSHPLTWTSSIDPLTGQSSEESRTFLHERPIATPQTGWNFVAQSRRWLPRELAGLLWFGVDDSSTTVRFPVYGSASRVAGSFAGRGAQDGVTPPVTSFSMQTAFGVFNLVANWAYTKWNLIYPVLHAEILRRESAYFSQIELVDAEALKIYESKGSQAAVEYVTDFSVQAGDQLVKEWADYFGQLFMTYRDGYVIQKSPSNTACGCASTGSSYPQAWYDRIVKETKTHYLYAEGEEDHLRGELKTKNGFMTVRKETLLAKR